MGRVRGASRRPPAVLCCVCVCVWPVGALGIDLMFNCFLAEAQVFQVSFFPFQSFFLFFSFLSFIFPSSSCSFFCKIRPLCAWLLVRNVKTYKNHFITGSLAGKRQQCKSLLAVCCLQPARHFYLNEYILRPYKVLVHDWTDPPIGVQRRVMETMNMNVSLWT